MTMEIRLTVRKNSNTVPRSSAVEFEGFLLRVLSFFQLLLSGTITNEPYCILHGIKGLAWLALDGQQ